MRPCQSGLRWKAAECSKQEGGTEGRWAGLRPAVHAGPMPPCQAGHTSEPAECSELRGWAEMCRAGLALEPAVGCGTCVWAQMQARPQRPVGWLAGQQPSARNRQPMQQRLGRQAAACSTLPMPGTPGVSVKQGGWRHTRAQSMQLNYCGKVFRVRGSPHC